MCVVVGGGGGSGALTPVQVHTVHTHSHKILYFIKCSWVVWSLKAAGILDFEIYLTGNKIVSQKYKTKKIKKTAKKII